MDWGWGQGIKSHHTQTCQGISYVHEHITCMKANVLAVFGFSAVIRRVNFFTSHEMLIFHLTQCNERSGVWRRACEYWCDHIRLKGHSKTSKDIFLGELFICDLMRFLTFAFVVRWSKNIRVNNLWHTPANATSVKGSLVWSKDACPIESCLWQTSAEVKS